LDFEWAEAVNPDARRDYHRSASQNHCAEVPMDSMVRSALARSSALRLAKALSIERGSGLYGGK